MKTHCFSLGLALVIITGVGLAAPAASPPTATITVRAGEPGLPISPVLYGVFFEDINCSADGGIYAELIRNRSFEDSEKPEPAGSTKVSGAEVSSVASTPGSSAAVCAATDSCAMSMDIKCPRPRATCSTR